jgi:2-polyprenyl-3-methyl-5-hydroxy-6-metoxy-1,4-benzoquinol methylase
VTKLKSKTFDDICFYCFEYNKIYNDYPVNKSVHDEFNDLTPRCSLHWQYPCNDCKKNVHFNGISYCNDCNIFTCVKCGEEKLQMQEFFFYDYYYEIKCVKCSKTNPTLDYLEFKLNHPVQFGKYKLTHQTQIWKPLVQPKPSHRDNNQKPWGSNRISAMAKNSVQIELSVPYSLNSREIWNIKAEKWNKYIGEEGDFHHRENILPVMFKLLNLKSYNDPKDIEVLDVACGTGNVARKIARMGFNVKGVDYSENMLSYAIAKNKELGLTIEYNQLDATKIQDYFRADTFDIIYCNMALMDMDNFEIVLQGISKLLKDRGIFVFSITHPIFSWPTAQTIRIPDDSQRGEDKIWVFDTYYRKKTLIKMESIEDSLLYYTRPISQYINECIKNGLQIVEVVEPRPTMEEVLKFPRENYYDNDRKPDFLMVKTLKIDLGYG